MREENLFTLQKYYTHIRNNILSFYWKIGCIRIELHDILN